MTATRLYTLNPYENLKKRMATATDERIALLRKQQEDLVKRGQAYQADPYQRGNVKAAQANAIQRDYQRLEYEIQSLSAQQQVEQGRITQEQAQAALQRSAQNIQASQSKGAPTIRDFRSTVNDTPGTTSGRDTRTGETARERGERLQRERSARTYGAPSEAENTRISEELRARGVSEGATPSPEQVYEQKRKGVRSSRLPDSIAPTSYAIKAEERQEYKQLQSERARTGATFSTLKGSVTPEKGQQFRNIYKQKQQLVEDELRTNRLRLGESDLLGANTSDSLQTPQTTSQKAKSALSGVGDFFKDLVRPLGKSLSLAGTYQYYPLDSTQEVQQGLLEDPETYIGTAGVLAIPLTPLALQYQGVRIGIGALSAYEVYGGAKTIKEGLTEGQDFKKIGYGATRSLLGVSGVLSEIGTTVRAVRGAYLTTFTKEVKATTIFDPAVLREEAIFPLTDNPHPQDDLIY